MHRYDLKHATCSILWANRTRFRAIHNSLPVATKSGSTVEQVEQMRQRMQTQDAASAWDSLWQDGVTPWDLGNPTEALITEAKSKSLTFKTALIPGCGSGHDLVALARYLDQVVVFVDDEKCQSPMTITGLEISSTSLQRAQQVVEESFERDGATKTQIDLYQGDFFAPPATWTQTYNGSNNNNKNANNSQLLAASETFDFIFDYLFFCAIPPDLRKDWGRQMARLVQRKDGQLLTLMFPFSKKTQRAVTAILKGPPYTVCLEDYEDALGTHGLQLQTPFPYASLDTAPARHGQEMVGWWSFSPPK